MITTLKIELFVYYNNYLVPLEVYRETKLNICSILYINQTTVNSLLRSHSVTLIGRVYTNKTNLFNCTVRVIEINMDCPSVTLMSM